MAFDGSPVQPRRGLRGLEGLSCRHSRVSHPQGCVSFPGTAGLQPPGRREASPSQQGRLSPALPDSPGLSPPPSSLAQRLEICCSAAGATRYMEANRQLREGMGLNPGQSVAGWGGEVRYSTLDCIWGLCYQECRCHSQLQGKQEGMVFVSPVGKFLEIEGWSLLEANWFAEGRDLSKVSGRRVHPPQQSMGELSSGESL